MSKYDDCHRVDNRYTTAIGMSVWRFFNIGKVYVKAGTDSVDVINLQTRRTKRYKVQYT